MAAMHKLRTVHAALAALAVCSAQTTTAAVAACSFSALSTPEANGRFLLQLTPAQDFRPDDGRQLNVPAWRINQAIASQIISRFNPAQPPVIDYEHQTLHKEKNGQPAPAAGWIHGLRWVEGKGLFAEAELTAKAQEEIKGGQYRYFSPVFLYDQENGDVLQMTMGALTNAPAVHGMAALNTMQAAASAQFSATSPQPEDSMTLLQQLLAKLGLPTTTTEQAALTAVADNVAFVAAVREGLKLKADDKPAAVTAACSAMLAAGTPDPAKYVPIDTHAAMQTQLAALTARQMEADIDAAVKPALADGRLNPAQEPWARDLGKSNLAALTSYLATAQPIAALTGTQTQGKPPTGQADGASNLTADELAVCSSMGLTPEAFAATKAAH